MSESHSDYAQQLPTQLQALYGASSRAESADIAREVLRINDAVRDLAQRHLDPLQPLISFHEALRREQDVTNRESDS